MKPLGNMDRAKSGPWQNIAVDGVILAASLSMYLGSLNVCRDADHLCLVLFVFALW